MSKKVRLDDLSKEVLIEQLRLCWKHFRVCAEVLGGNEDVQPVELLECKESEDNDELELFYKCKKVCEELAYLNKIVKDNNIEENGTGE